MKINVGTKNEVKVRAVEEVLCDYEIFSSAEVVPVTVESGVAKQPKSIDETVQGAINRARNSFKECDYSIGLESGLMKVPHTKTGFMDFCVCAIYDGKEFHLGLSLAFELPPKVANLILEEGLDINEACYKIGLTQNPKIGNAEGIIGLLTKGRVTREDYTKQALTSALIHLENLDLYE